MFTDYLYMRTSHEQRSEAQLRRKFFAKLSFKKAGLSYLAGSCTKSYIHIHFLEIIWHYALTA